MYSTSCNTNSNQLRLVAMSTQFCQRMFMVTKYSITKVVTWMHSFPLIFLWFTYQNVWNCRYEILHTLNLSEVRAIITDTNNSFQYSKRIRLVLSCLYGLRCSFDLLMSSPQNFTVQVSMCPNVDLGKQNIGSFSMKIWCSLYVIIEDLILLTITFNGKMTKQFVLIFVCLFLKLISQNSKSFRNEKGFFV